MSRLSHEEIVERLRELTAMLRVGKGEEALKELKKLRKEVNRDYMIGEKIAAAVLFVMAGILIAGMLYMR